MDVLGVLAVGFVAGMAAGLLGIGGGALFVPALVLFLGLSQLDAQATSLLAIVPVAAVGAARQQRYVQHPQGRRRADARRARHGRRAGRCRARQRCAPERALEVSFAMLQLVVAFQLARRALRNDDEETA